MVPPSMSLPPTERKRLEYADPSNRKQWTSIDGVAGESTLDGTGLNIDTSQTSTHLTVFDNQGRISEETNLLDGSTVRYGYQHNGQAIPTTIATDVLGELDIEKPNVTVSIAGIEVTNAGALDVA